ncbi:MAG: NAD(P) transhydrogenase subunit alpha, partial [Luminiphilus sp.]|nr:NAD(P) transhydrogenase subunit alpha [Luminiphilus sp.]
MRIVIPRESVAGERRTSATPETVKKMIRLGADVAIESGAGDAVGYDDSLYSDLGAEIVSDRAALMGSADMVLRLRKPEPADIDMMKPGCIHVSYLDPFNERDLIKTLAAKEITAVSMEMIPRSTRSQKMDALSSQANLAGYVAVMLAAAQLPSIFPMLMTPAGTLKPAKIFIIGAGVAGLQAIATAKRLGGRVTAFDTRPVVAEQVQSLGGKFLEIDLGDTGQTADGYAKELTPEQVELQRQAQKSVIADSDVVITTAQVFGRKPPVLVTKDMVAGMAP